MTAPLDPPTFLTRDALGVTRAYNDRGQRCPLAAVPEGLPVVDILPEVPQAVHVARANTEHRERKDREARGAREGAALDEWATFGVEAT